MQRTSKLGGEWERKKFPSKPLWDKEAFVWKRLCWEGSPCHGFSSLGLCLHMPPLKSSAFPLVHSAVVFLLEWSYYTCTLTIADNMNSRLLIVKPIPKTLHVSRHISEAQAGHLFCGQSNQDLACKWLKVLTTMWIQLDPNHRLLLDCMF